MAETETQHITSAPSRVLIVEDDVDAAEALLDYLQPNGFDCVLAYDLAQAKRALPQDEPSVILLDIRLGTDFGLDLLPWLQEHRPAARVIVITGHADTDTAVEALRRGAYDFLRKPVDPAVLVTRLKRASEFVHLKAEREQHIRAVERSETNMRIAQQVGRFGSWDLDLRTGVGYWSEEHLRLFGVDPDHFVPTRKAFLECVWPDDRPQVIAAFESMGHMPGPVVVDYRIKRPDGSMRHMYSAAMQARGPDGTAERWYGVVQDITERKQVEEELRFSRELLSGILDMAVDAIISIDAQQQIVLFNKGAERIFGYSAAELKGKSLTTLLPAAFRDSHAAHVMAFAESGEASRPMNERGVVMGRRRSGEEFRAEASLSRSHSDQGEIYTVVLRDVSERIAAETRLQENEARLRQALDIAKLGTWEWHADTNLLQWSDETFLIFGVPRHEFHGKVAEYAARLYPEDKLRLRALIDAAIQDRAPYRMEHRIVRPDGTERMVQQQAEVIFDCAGRLERIVGILQDITERTLTEERLRQSQKMEAVGQLAGGMAHEVNNMLQIIHGYTELALQGVPDADTRDDLGHVLAAANRSTEIVRHLLAFSRKDALQRSLVDLNDRVTNLAHVLPRLIGPQIELQVTTADGVAAVQADSGMLDQVLINICVNARDAMPQGGVLKIATASVDVSPAYAQINGWTLPGRYAQVTIADTGLGMPLEVRQRIFEPFFTTKEVGKGSGIGLSVAYGIVQHHGGRIDVASEPGAGSTFTISLPVAEQATPAADEQPESAQARGGNETILIADDEPLVLGLLAGLLQNKGYQVLTAQDGAAAVKVFRENESRVDLVILDVMMPKLSGTEARAGIHAINPSVPVILSTGYAGNYLDPSVLEGDELSVIRKPYSAESLHKIVRRLLDRS